MNMDNNISFQNPFFNYYFPYPVYNPPVGGYHFNYNMSPPNNCNQILPSAYYEPAPPKTTYPQYNFYNEFIHENPANIQQNNVLSPLNSGPETVSMNPSKNNKKSSPHISKKNSTISCQGLNTKTGKSCRNPVFFPDPSLLLEISPDSPPQYCSRHLHMDPSSPVMLCSIKKCKSVVSKKFGFCVNHSEEFLNNSSSDVLFNTLNHLTYEKNQIQKQLETFETGDKLYFRMYRRLKRTKDLEVLIVEKLKTQGIDFVYNLNTSKKRKKINEDNDNNNVNNYNSKIIKLIEN